MQRLAKKSRVVKDYGLRNGTAELNSNTCIAEGEIVAVFGETATIWAHDDVCESERIATQQNTIESIVQKQDYPDSEMDEWDWDDMEASHFKETTTAIKQPVLLPPPTENNQEVGGGNRQDDYSDHDVDNLDWEVLEHPRDTDAKTKLDNTSRLPSSLTCEQRQAHWLLCQDKCGCKNSLPNLGGITRTIQDYGLRNGVVDLISNTHIALGEITAVIRETSTVWEHNNADEFDRIATQQNTIDNTQQFKFYVSGNTQ